MALATFIGVGWASNASPHLPKGVPDRRSTSGDRHPLAIPPGSDAFDHGWHDTGETRAVDEMLPSWESCKMQVVAEGASPRPAHAGLSGLSTEFEEHWNELLRFIL